ncbi:MAG: hypothetical protein EXS59_02435 [Candidatus Taylorbacteria bacterium]|nr:hypothetical protein [Candidatus Taylorbacteria bacterium]
MHEDVKWLFGVIIVFGLVWYVSGRFNSDTSNKPFIRPFAGGGEVGVYGPDIIHMGQSERIGTGPSMSSKTPGISAAASIKQQEVIQNLQNSGLRADQIDNEIATLGQAGGTSPLTGKISIQNMRQGGTTPKEEYIVLKASSENKEKILLTGLRLESSVSGRGADLPNGVSLPFQNQVNVEQPIYLSPGDTVYITTGRSPIGTSFKTNKCTGYFNQYQTFNPTLGYRCPAPNAEPLTPPLSQYNDKCIDYIDTLPRCQIVANIPAIISPECQRHLTTEINYTKCVERHKNDKDFYDSEWRVYLNYDDVLWKSKRELIHLLDRNGKIIDAITY